MGQIIGGAAKPKRCNLNKLSQLGTPAAGEYILVSSDNSMNAAGQGNFDCYIEGDGTTAAAALQLHYINDTPPLGSTDNLIDERLPVLAKGLTFANGEIYGKLSTWNNLIIPVPSNSGPYILSFQAYCEGNSSTSGTGLGIRIYYTDDSYGSVTLANNVSQWTLKTLLSTPNKVIDHLMFYYSSSGANIVHVKELQLRSGSEQKAYIPHDTGIDYVSRMNLDEKTGEFRIVDYIDSGFIVFEQGSLAYGANMDSTTRIRTASAFNTSDFSITSPKGFVIASALYYSSWTSATNYVYTNAETINSRYFKANTAYPLCRLIVKKEDGSAITPSDLVLALPSVLPKLSSINERLFSVESSLKPLEESGVLSTTADCWITINGDFHAGDKYYVSAIIDANASVNRDFVIYQDSTRTSIFISAGTENEEIELPYDSSSLRLYMTQLGVTSGGGCTFIVRGRENYLIEQIPIQQEKIDAFEEINGEMSIDNVMLSVGLSDNYIRYDGAVRSNSSYSISTPFQLQKNGIVKFYGKGATGVVAIISREENGVYTPLVVADTDNFKTYSYQNTTGENINIVLSSTTAQLTSCTITDAGKIGEIGNLGELDTLNTSTLVSAINEVNSKVPSSSPTLFGGADIGVFAHGVCVGDSLTEGTFNYNDSGTTRYTNITKYSYPKKLSELMGIEIANLGLGGKTTAQWYNQMSGEDLSGYDFAIIQLGVNDHVAGQTEWPASDKTAMQNIITKLKNENNNIFIFVSTIIPATSYGGRDYISQGIMDLVEEINDPHVILLDMAVYSNIGDSAAYNCGHLSAYGYWRLAKDYYNYISWYINQNKLVFREVQFIGTNLSYT